MIVEKVFKEEGGGELEHYTYTRVHNIEREESI